MEQPNYVAAMRGWLRAKAHKWVVKRRPALAAVIEVASSFETRRELVPVVEAVLADDDADQLVASVAAQRARRLPDLIHRQTTIGASLARWIDVWLGDPTTRHYALTALPSAFRFLQDSDPVWFERHITSHAVEVVWATCQGILLEPPEQIGADVAAKWYPVVLARLRSMTLGQMGAASETTTTLLMTLATLCSVEQAMDVATLCADVVRLPVPLGRAGAVNAGRMLVLRHGEPGMAALRDAFGTAWGRYFPLLEKHP